MNPIDEFEKIIWSHIRKHYERSGDKPKFILMNPETADTWANSFNPYSGPRKLDGSLTFRGIRILRSYDLSETEIEVVI